jgi:hypothetical protein
VQKARLVLARPWVERKPEASSIELKTYMM